MNSSSFFNLSLRQSVNSWLGIGLLTAMCFWVVIYYFANSTEIIGTNLAKIATTNATQSVPN